MPYARDEPVAPAVDRLGHGAGRAAGRAVRQAGQGFRDGPGVHLVRGAEQPQLHADAAEVDAGDGQRLAGRQPQRERELVGARVQVGRRQFDAGAHAPPPG